LPRYNAVALTACRRTIDQNPHRARASETHQAVRVQAQIPGQFVGAFVATHEFVPEGFLQHGRAVFLPKVSPLQ
jgi:hypothetical protein